MEPPALVAVDVSADENGLVVVCSNPTESVYKKSPSGLFLPKHVTPTPPGWIENSPYPEFSAAVVEAWDQAQNAPLSSKFILPTLAYPSKQLFAKPKPKAQWGLSSLIPEMEAEHEIKCPEWGCNYHRGTPMPTVISAIVHLNDGHHWPREKIANWLDTLDIDLRIKKVKL